MRSLLERLFRRRKLTPEELAEREQIRRQAEVERRRAETEMADQRQRIESSGNQPGGWGGWS
jgi:hypothetical protein